MTNKLYYTLYKKARVLFYIFFLKYIIKSETFILYFPKDNQENNSKNVIIENNSLEINNATSNDVTGILSSNAQNITFDNNKITSNARINEAFTGEIESMSNNKWRNFK